MPKKILVADDEPSIRNSLKAILERYKYQVVTAENGEECMQMVLKERPD